jgi:transposase-like protein
MIRRMTGRDRVSANQLAEEVGVHQSTLSRWLRHAGQQKNEVRGNGHVPQRDSMRPDDLPPREKFQLILDASGLSEEELGAFLRRHGLHEAQLEEWRETALGALQKPKKKRPGKSPEAKKIQELEREVTRKDKALAEVTALLALKKKLDALLGDEDDNTTPRNAR